MGQKLVVVVTGGTGKQGGAVVKRLLERGHEVRAVTRRTDSAKARELANAGATLVRASLEDTAALAKALEGATSLFAMTTPFEGGTHAETRQGMSAADAARAAGVHLVFSSVGSANRQTGVPHFDSKYVIEEHIARIGVRATVLAPVYFMENLYFGKEQLAKGACWQAGVRRPSGPPVLIHPSPYAGRLAAGSTKRRRRSSYRPFPAFRVIAPTRPVA
jgi:uncharacterized protein YbjT (DUF2867 family)